MEGVAERTTQTPLPSGNVLLDSLRASALRREGKGRPPPSWYSGLRLSALDMLQELHPVVTDDNGVFHLAVALMDAFVAACNKRVQKVSFLVCAALTLACKYLDRTPEYDRLADALHHPVTPAQLRQAERAVFIVLDFDVYFVTAYDFLMAHGQNRKMCTVDAERALRLRLRDPNCMTLLPEQLALSVLSDDAGGYATSREP